MMRYLKERRALVQSMRFTAVGAAATLTHICVALLLDAGGLPALQANLGAFAAAWLLSYFGNHAWTFGGVAAHRQSMPRFLAVSLLALLINQLLVWGIVEVMKQPLAVALLPVVLVVPAISFLANRRWVFATR